MTEEAFTHRPSLRLLLDRPKFLQWTQGLTKHDRLTESSHAPVVLEVYSSPIPIPRHHSCHSGVFFPTFQLLVHSCANSCTNTCLCILARPGVPESVSLVCLSTARGCFNGYCDHWFSLADRDTRVHAGVQPSSARDISLTQTSVYTGTCEDDKERVI